MKSRSRRPVRHSIVWYKTVVVFSLILLLVVVMDLPLTTMMTITMKMLTLIEVRWWRDGFRQLGVHLYSIRNEMTLIVVVYRPLVHHVDPAACLVCPADVDRVSTPAIVRRGKLGPRRHEVGDLSRYEWTRVRGRHVDT